MDETNKLLKELIKINAEISNQNLEIITKLDIIRMNTYNTSKNTFKWEYKPEDNY